MIKIKNIIRLFSVVYSMLLFQACPINEFGKMDLELKNNSNDTLCVYVANGSHSAYPDTLLPEKYENVTMSRIDNNMTSPIYCFVTNLVSSPEKFFQKLPKDTLSIFIFNEFEYDTIPKILMDSIWNEMNYGKLFLLRYDLSLKDLEKLDFLLTYPPDNIMKNVRQYPPYKN